MPDLLAGPANVQSIAIRLGEACSSPAVLKHPRYQSTILERWSWRTVLTSIAAGHVRHSAPIPPGKANSLPLRLLPDFPAHDSPLNRVTGDCPALAWRSVPVGMESWRCQRPLPETRQRASSVYFRLHRPWCTPGPASPYQHRPSECLGFTIFRNRRRRGRGDLSSGIWRASLWPKPLLQRFNARIHKRQHRFGNFQQGASC